MSVLCNILIFGYFVCFKCITSIIISFLKSSNVRCRIIDQMSAAIYITQHKFAATGQKRNCLKPSSNNRTDIDSSFFFLTILTIVWKLYSFIFIWLNPRKRPHQTRPLIVVTHKMRLDFTLILTCLTNFMPKFCRLFNNDLKLAYFGKSSV